MEKDKRLMGAWLISQADGRAWLQGSLVLALMGGTMLRKSLIQFSADGWYSSFLVVCLGARLP